MFRTLKAQSSNHRRLSSTRCRIQTFQKCAYHNINHHASKPSLHSITSTMHTATNLMNKRTLSWSPSSSPFKSLINRLHSNTHSLPTNKSILHLMHDWIPSIKLQQHNQLRPILSHLTNILFNSSKTPRGFGQFTKKSSKTTKKSETSSDPKPKTETTKSSKETKPSSKDS